MFNNPFHSPPRSTALVSPGMAECFAQTCQRLAHLIPDAYPSIDRKSDKKSVMVETRNLVHLEFVIKNTIHQLGDGWGHMIFCSRENLTAVQSICGEISSEIEIVLLDRQIESMNAYNNLCHELGFWNQVDCKTVLVYQTDTFIFKPFDADFLAYDYIGAPWGPGLHSEQINKHLRRKQKILTGNGGLSLRNLDLMKKALADRRFRDSLRDSNFSSLDQIPEDVFFATYAAEHGKTADVKAALRFSFEYCEDFKLYLDLSEDAFGAHKIYDFFSHDKDLESYLEGHFYKWLFSKNALLPNPEPEIIGYVHAACMGNHWLEIFRELYEPIFESGLYARTAKIYMCVSGSERNFYELKAQFGESAKIEWVWNGDVLRFFEYPTLDLLHQNATERASHQIWYVHTKGVSCDYGNPYYKYWRKALIQSNIVEWKKHHLALEEYNVSGESWCEDRHYPKHYSGNFWWANSDYVSQLKNIRHFWNHPREDWRMVPGDRFQPEMWLSTGNVRAKSFGTWNPIRFKDMAGMGFSHFIFSPDLDQSVCSLNAVAQRKHLINPEKKAGSFFKCQLEFEKIGLENVIRVETRMPFPASHQKILENAAKENLESLLVMEDDVTFVHGFSEIFNFAFAQVPEDWEMIWIGYVERQGRRASLVTDFVAVPHQPQGTFCYLLNKEGIRKVLKNMENSDPFLAPTLFSGLKQYEIIPALACQRGSAVKRFSRR